MTQDSTLSEAVTVSLFTFLLKNDVRDLEQSAKVGINKSI
jgi:hypothetical protein